MSARGRPHPHLVKLSKFLVYVCRHGALDWGLRADPDGWLDIDDVLSLKPSRVLERGHVVQIVEDACEGRLEIDSSGSRIRARTPQTKSVLLPYDEVIEWGLKADPDGWLDIDEVRGGETRMITMTVWALPSQKSLGWHGHVHVCDNHCLGFVSKWFRMARS